MKGIIGLLLAPAALCVSTAGAKAPESPINKVVIFIEELRKEITADTAKEAADYATYAAWCNDTIAQVTTNIEKEEATIEECNRKIEELSGTGAASGAEIAHAEKNLAENKDRTKEALSIREKELKEYTETTDKLKEEINDLNAAKQQLLEGQNATNTSGSFFLQKKDSHQTRAAAFLRKFLAAPSASEKLDEDALQTLNSFVQSASERKSPQLMQLDRDSEEAAPASALDSVVAVVNEAVKKFDEELKEAETEEAARKKTFDELMKTLTEEKTTLEKNLLAGKKSKGSDGSELAAKTTLRDETTVQKKADTKLLTTTQDSCKEKAYQFSQRSAMRADELKGINLTLDILTSNSSKATFTGAAVISFTQLAKSKAAEAAQAKSGRGVGHQAYMVLKAVASKYRDLKLAQIAVKCKSGGVGAFYRVIQTIDAQIKHLQDEEKEDVEHRDRCQDEIADNAASIATLADTIQKTTTDIRRLNSKADETKDALKALKEEISETKTDIANLTKERDSERNDFLVAVKHDKEALALIKAAIKQVTAFSKNNKISLSLAQEKEVSLLAQAHGYKPAPDAGFDDANYKGGKDSTKAVVEMMEMVQEDMASEIKSGQEEDAENQALYEKDFKALNELLETQETKEISLNKQLAELQGEIQSMTDTNSSKTDEHAAELQEKASLAVDCDWIKKKFGERRKKRKDEIDGLVSAKGLLAGAEP
eukprot:TRINITY_DN1072_c0_g1_i5.p1 TRINITY_DN1072_c0_g1~~TRINITY_DN1072_c0_g1_i5.p1  ORF type:complete len:711 (-),score=230.79 TRINITY_DN1072_c0_g1_i5:135-2267(-)